MRYAAKHGEPYDLCSPSRRCRGTGVLDTDPAKIMKGNRPHHEVYEDADTIAFLALQRVARRVASAVSEVVPAERIYSRSLGSKQGNAHLHWHVAPLPPGVPYDRQQYHALMTENGVLDVADSSYAMRLMLDNPGLRAVPGNLSRLGGQAGNEAEQVQRHLLGDVRRYPLGDAGLPARVRQQISDGGRAARRAVSGRRAELGVPEQVIPVRMRRKPCRNGLAQLATVVREGGHFVAEQPGSMSSTPARPCTTTALLWQNSLSRLSSRSAR